MDWSELEEQLVASAMKLAGSIALYRHCSGLSEQVFIEKDMGVRLQILISYCQIVLNNLSDAPVLENPVYHVREREQTPS